MGYYSDFGLRLELREDKGKGYLQDLFTLFLKEEKLEDLFEDLEWLDFEDLFQEINYYERETNTKDILYTFDIKGYGLKFYSDFDYDGKWVEEFVNWLNDKEICGLHFIRIGEDYTDIEEISNDYIYFYCGLKREIEFN